jgi:hypothetical protein
MNDLIAIFACPTWSTQLKALSFCGLSGIELYSAKQDSMLYAL